MEVEKQRKKSVSSCEAKRTIHRAIFGSFETSNRISGSRGMLTNRIACSRVKRRRRVAGEVKRRRKNQEVRFDTAMKVMWGTTNQPTDRHPKRERKNEQTHSILLMRERRPPFGQRRRQTRESRRPQTHASFLPRHGNERTNSTPSKAAREGGFFSPTRQKDASTMHT